MAQTKKLKPPKKRIPNSRRAICHGYFATVYKGRRLVRLYYSGELLQGRIEA